MSQQYIYTMQAVSKIVPPKREILKNIWLSFYPGAKIGVLGLNGAGKSTLLRIIAGVDTDFIGEARALSGIKIGYLPQEPHLDPNKDVRGNVEVAIADTKKLLDRFNEISMQFAEPLSDASMNQLLEEQGELQTQIDLQGGWELERKLSIAAHALGLPPWEAQIAQLSGGERRRVALCQLLLSNPDMLLLDEPTNHLDAQSVAWLERYLHEYPGTVIAVTHDRYFLDNVAGWILELDRGQGIPYEGNYSAWLEQKQKRLAQEGRQQAAHEKSLKAELEWVRTNPKGRQAKSKARLARFEELSSQEFQKRAETQELYIPPGLRLGDSILDFDKLSKGFDGRLLIDNFSFTVPKGAIVGIIGPNGAGKSTLFKLIMQLEQPDSGEIRQGASVQLAYIDQSRDALNPAHSVWQEISDGLDIMTINQFQMPSRSYVGRFNFKGTEQQKLVKNLSGGERNRVHLAKLLRAGGNVLLLDEPTNDLDVETLRALEEALLSFPGCALVISHDRWFLDRITTHILAFQDNGHIDCFTGNFTEYETDRLNRLGANEGQAEKRTKYKKLTH
ncbi:MAG: energy-dependent translational throttle protein EttA [Candidatus Aquirickettsiella gammari]|jgi:ATP-binding cassette ChvD family protein|uniref:Energy-dependent translational throttle protein EttA n=1 Tax=Candidatus Aquirickettsiella gammari TaxID=2016198 RepID=A0A370CHU5_9COXI|nr:MAG: energy-dependent translational throttle protein EttA [Candidatus Aquirickettsiella gammari]